MRIARALSVTMPSAVALLAGAVLALAGCGGASGQTRTQIGTCGPGQALLSEIPRESTSLVPGQLLDRAGCDAATRSGVSVDHVRVMHASSQEWPDPSMLCPEPGGAGPAVTTPGYWLFLGAGGRTYDYRSDKSTTGPLAIILCKRPSD